MGSYLNKQNLKNCHFNGRRAVQSGNSIGIRVKEDSSASTIKSGATRVLYTSHMGSSSTSYFPPMVHHAATEDLLKESGMRHTSIRNGFYASSLVGLIGDAVKTGELIVLEDGPIAWTTHSDLAQATAMILTEKNWDGPSPNLTAFEAIDMEGVAVMVSDIVGRPIYRKSPLTKNIGRI